MILKLLFVFTNSYAITGSQETDMPIIGFDMGGTSTDVSRYAGKYEHVVESTTAGVTIQAPQLDINTVAAGGGSMLFFRSGLFVVGPGKNFNICIRMSDRAVTSSLPYRVCRSTSWSYML